MSDKINNKMKDECIKKIARSVIEIFETDSCNCQSTATSGYIAMSVEQKIDSFVYMNDEKKDIVAAVANDLYNTIIVKAKANNLSVGESMIAAWRAIGAIAITLSKDIDFADKCRECPNNGGDGNGS